MDDQQLRLFLDWAAARRHWLTRVPSSPSPIVCPGCRGPKNRSAFRCHGCTTAHSTLGVDAAFAAPVTLATKATPLYDALVGYKNDQSEDARARHASSLASFLIAHLQKHLACLEREAGGSFRSLTLVPSLRRQPPYPLHRIAAAAADASSLRFADLLSPSRPNLPVREHDPNTYAASGVPPDARILLVEDLWVSGAHAQSAAHALLAGGAASVAILPIARLVDPAFSPASNDLIRLARAEPFDPAICSLCRQRD